MMVSTPAFVITSTTLLMVRGIVMTICGSFFYPSLDVADDD